MKGGEIPVPVGLYRVFEEEQVDLIMANILESQYVFIELAKLDLNLSFFILKSLGRINNVFRINVVVISSTQSVYGISCKSDENI